MDSYMSWIDWVIMIIPICMIMGLAFYTPRFVRGVSDFLSCGRLCGRYVLSLGDVASALSIIGLVAFIEQAYKTGFALSFWGGIMIPLSVVLSMTGFCVYRFRETRAMSMGQFMEIRYGSRAMRFFAAALRSLAEMLANMIMPAIAARFFIQMLNLPTHIWGIPTYDILIVLFLVMAITIICMGGTLALVITNTLQGTLLYPLLLCFIIFLVCKFSWSREIIPVMMDRLPGESNLNPYDIGKLRDFNIFSTVFVAVYAAVINRPTWMGAGADTAAKSAHEAKMANLIGSWRFSIISVFYVVIACCLITFLNHKRFASEACQVRKTLVNRLATTVSSDKATQDVIMNSVKDLPPQIHEIGVDTPLGQNENLDSEFLDNVHQALKNDARAKVTKGMSAEEQALEDTRRQVIDAEGKANDLFQQCRTLYNQLTLSVTMRALLPTGLFGAFCLLLFLAMLSTDDTRIYSATLTISQDCILPFFPNGLSPKKHILMIRLVAIGVGFFFALGSHFMAQLDYINLFVSLAVAMWSTGAGPVMTLGLYWKKGTRQAAWAGLLTGMFLSIGYILIQRNWTDVVYPFLAKNNLVELCDTMLSFLDAPWGNLVEWKMNELKCPVNSYEFSFFAGIFVMLLYIVVSLLTCKEDFNMDKMLHRGKYMDPNEPPKNLDIDWSPRNILRNIIGITPEYSKFDRFIAYGIFVHIFIYAFVLCFVCVLIWNCFAPWKIQYWSTYFLVNTLVVPAIIAVICFFWLGYCGVKELFQLFRDLMARKYVNEHDDGRVE